MADIVVITGLSGAGRSGVADVMEDLGWYVVDNLPASLVEKVVELASLPGASGIDRIRVVRAGRGRAGLRQPRRARVPRRRAARAAPPLRPNPPQAPACRRRRRTVGVDRARTGDARTDSRSGRPRDRHDRAEHPP